MKKSIFKKSINITGLRCPESMMMIRKTIRKMKKKEILLIISDDPSVIKEMTTFCFFMNHKLIHKSKKNNLSKYFLKK